MFVTGNIAGTSIALLQSIPPAEVQSGISKLFVNSPP
jgi:hypothetical protein